MTQIKINTAIIKPYYEYYDNIWSYFTSLKTYHNTGYQLVGCYMYNMVINVICFVREDFHQINKNSDSLPIITKYCTLPMRYSETIAIRGSSRSA